MRTWLAVFGVILIVASNNLVSSIASIGGDGWEKGNNVSLYAKTEVYNCADQNNDPSKAVDGDKNTYVSFGLYAGSEAWLLIDLGKEYYLYDIHLYANRASLEQTNDLPPIGIQSSLDTKCWKTLGSLPLDSSNLIVKHLSINCAGEKARYVRIYRSPLSVGWHPSLDIISIFEVEVYEGRDVSPPDTEITNGPGDGESISENKISFVWKGVDNELEDDLSFEYKLYQEGYEYYANWIFSKERSVTFEIFKDIRGEGRYTFEVRAVDSFGNVDPTPAKREFFADIFPPSVHIISPESGSLYVAGRKICDIVVEGDYAVMIGRNSEIEVEVENSGGELAEAELLLDNVPVDSENLNGFSTSVDFSVYNGLHEYKVKVFSKSGKYGEDRIKIKGFLTGRDPPGYVGISSDAPPYQLTKPTGPSEGNVGKDYKFSCKADDIEKDEIYFLFIWGDGTNSGWMGPFGPGETAEASHSWNREGRYEIRVYVSDSKGNCGEWFSCMSVEIKRGNKDNSSIGKGKVIAKGSKSLPTKTSTIYRFAERIFKKVDSGKDKISKGIEIITGVSRDKRSIRSLDRIQGSR